MCTYHSNFIEAIDALHKNVPAVPKYNDGFVRQFLCEISSKDCWFAKCTLCSGISIDKLKDLVDKDQLKQNVSWIVWNKVAPSNRIEKQNKTRTLADLLAHIAAMAPQFLKHSYIKREQSEMFNLHDRPRAINSEFEDEGMLQIDFAENYVCVQQDEVQSAHWKQNQLTLFTSAFYFNDTFQSKVIVSDNKVHGKETIVPYLYKLLSKMPSELKVLKIWNDGPTSQFKNKYIAAIIPHLEIEFGIKIFWNFFATAHGKGCVDGLGATAKMVVMRHVKARDSIVNNAADFVKAFGLTSSAISVEQVTDEDIDCVNSILDTNEIYSSAKDVKNIFQAHQIQCIRKKTVIYETSKLGYN